MIQFLPKRYIGGIPRWIELFIYSLLSLVLIYILVEIHFFDIISYPNSYKNNYYMFLSYLICLILILFYNLYPTSTIVDIINIDNLNQKIIIYYSKYFLIKRKCEINYKDFAFKYYDTIGLNNLSFDDYKVDGFKYSYVSVKIYKERKKVVKFVSRNGWKKSIVDNIIEEFNKISPTKKSPKQFL